MKKVEKRKLNKNLLQLVILGATLLVLIGALVTVQLLPPKQTEKEQVKLPEIREELGEALYLNVPLAYPIIQENQLDYIVVEHKDKEGNPRAFAVSALGNGSYVLEYSKDGTTETLTPYLPSIIGAEGNFDLASLYARETGTGLGQVYLLTYLFALKHRNQLAQNKPRYKKHSNCQGEKFYQHTFLHGVFPFLIHFLKFFGNTLCGNKSACLQYKSVTGS